MSNRLSAEKIKKSQTLGKIVSEFTQSESPFELDLKVSYSHTNLSFFFPDTNGDFHLFNLITDNLMQYNPLVH